MTTTLTRSAWLAAIGLAALSAFAAAQESGRVSARDTRALIDAGSFEDAAMSARAAYETAKSLQGEGSLQAAAAGDLLVRAWLLDGRASDAQTLALARRVLAIKESDAPSAHLDLVPSLLNLGDALTASAEFDSALPAFARAVALCEARASPGGLDLAEVLDHLGDALSAAGRHDEAMKALERGLLLKEAALAPSDPSIARTLEHLGSVLHSKGEYSVAAPLVWRAASIQRAANERHPAYVGTLNLMAQQLWFEGRLVESKVASEQAVALAGQTLRPAHPTLALSLRFLANTLADLGESSRSLELTKRALAVVELNSGPGHHTTAEYLHSLGLAELGDGDYPGARRHFEQALAIYRRRYGASHELVATAHSVLALADARLGDYASARREQSLAMSTFTKIGGPAHPYVAGALTKLASVYLEEGQPAQALPLLERALVIRERVLTPSHRDIARTLVDLAATLMQLGQPVRAQRLARRALDIWEQLDAPDAPDHATVLTLYAQSQAARGDHQAARDYYEKAMEIRSRVFGTANPLYAQAQSGFAIALANLGQSAVAFRAAEQAEVVGRSHLRLMLRTLPERQALNYAASRPRALQLLLSLAAKMPESVAIAFDAVIRSRALVLDEIAARQGSADADPTRSALAKAQQRLANLMVRGPGQSTTERYTALLDEARVESERAEQALAEASVAFRTERSRAQVGLGEVTASLPDDAALVSFARYDRVIVEGNSPASAAPANRGRVARSVPAYIAFVLRSNGSAVLVSVGEALAIDTLVSRWRTQIAAEVTQPTGTAGSTPAASSRDSGAALRRRIWDPIEPHLSGATRVIIVPDGALSLVPFGALPVDGRSFVVESAPVIHYLSAERDLTLAPVARVESGLFALGGAQFGRMPSSGATSASSPADAPSGPPIRGPGQPCADLHSLSFQPLGGTAREVEEVSTVWQDSVGSGVASGLPRVLVGAAATEASFKADAARHRVLHLATHGFFLDRACAPSPSGARGVGRLTTTPVTPQNPLRLSGLALAGANRRAQAGPDEDDGILTAEEVSMLDLHGVEWAVLSACDTGVGEIRAGEGVFGLRRAFQVAGARTVIMSLWSVDDQATRQWMRALYEGRFQRQLSTADAVHQASLTVLRDRRARKLSTHPFFWAAFVAAGDWR